MFRQASIRNNRNKGFKVKHVLQICLLLAVCIWLLYQIKHSHDKKKAFDENNAKIANKLDSGNQILKLGRKDLNHGVEETSEKHGEEDEREEEEEGKQEDMIDKERGDGDDEIDENDQEKVDEAAERGEEFSDEDKEAREKEENEEKEENDGQSENAGSSENHDHEYRNSQEAREEHYKGDDASSAVVRDNQMIRMEGDNEGLRNSDEEHENNIAKNDSESDHNTNTTEDATVDQNDSKPNTHELLVATGDEEMTVNNPSVNETSAEKGVVVSMFKLDNESLQNLPATDSFDQVTLQNNATVNTSETPGLDLKNETPILESTQDRNATINMGASDQNPSSENIGSEQMEKSNATDVLKETVAVVLEQSEKSNATTVSEEPQNPISEQTNLVEQSEKPNTSAEVKETQAIILEQTESNITTVGEESQNVVSEQAALGEKSEKVELEQSEKSSTTLQVEESGYNTASPLTTNENSDAAQSEPTDSSASLVTQEEKDAIADLGTLPHIESEGSNTDDIAAE